MKRQTKKELEAYITEIEQEKQELEKELNSQIDDLVRQNKELEAYYDKFIDLAGSIELALDMLEGREIQYGRFNIVDILKDNDLTEVAA